MPNTSVLRTFTLTVLILWASQAPALEEALGPDGVNMASVHQQGFEGQGVSIAIISANNARAGHEAFLDNQGVGRVTNWDFSGSGIAVSSHDTWITGAAGSNGGDLYPGDRGTAPQAMLHSARIINDSSTLATTTLPEALEELLGNQGCRVVFSGIALSGVVPDGSSFWTLVYDYYAYVYDVLFVHPAGNDTTCIAVFGDARNGLTVGGLNVTTPDVYRQVGTTTGQGPTTDGRRKPDLTAPCQNLTLPTATSDTGWTTWTSTGGETSFCTPLVAGCGAALLSYADQSPSPDDDHAAVLRAVMANNAFSNIRDRNGDSTTAIRWHTQRGYGRLDGAQALANLQGQQLYNENHCTEDRAWAYNGLSVGESHRYTIDVPENGRLRAAITWDQPIRWTDQKTGFPRQYNGLIDPGELAVNAVEISWTVTEISSGQILYSGPGTSDNLDTCDLPIVVPGAYRITVSHQNGPDAPYALAVAWKANLPGDFNGDFIVNIHDLNQLSTQWVIPKPNTTDGLWNLRDFNDLIEHWELWDREYYDW